MKLNIIENTIQFRFFIYLSFLFLAFKYSNPKIYIFCYILFFFYIKNLWNSKQAYKFLKVMFKT